MVEKKQVLYDLRTAYSGPFIVEEFYAEVDNWINANGFEKEPKSKKEHLTKTGKKLELAVEAHKQFDERHHGIIVIRALLDNVKELIVKKDGRKTRINNGDVYVHIDGFIQSHEHSGFWEAKPVYFFIRTLIDKYIYNFWTDKYDGRVNADCRDLFKNVKSFFELQKYKFESFINE